MPKHSILRVAFGVLKGNYKLLINFIILMMGLHKCILYFNDKYLVKECGLGGINHTKSMQDTKLYIK